MYVLFLLDILKSRTLHDADCIRIVPAKHRGQGEIVPIAKKNVSMIREVRFMSLMSVTAFGLEFLHV